MTSEFEQLEDRAMACKFARAQSQVFDPEDQHSLAEAFAGEFQHATFVKWFEKRGIVVSDKTVARHRQGSCSCGR